MPTFAYGEQDASDDDSPDVSMLGVSTPVTPGTPTIQIVEETIGGPTEQDGTDTPSKMDARAYQLEMFEASMRENIIVAMDTGSGKTLVALLRMRAELDTCAPDKIIWFLAPTVILCSQQHAFIEKQIPSVSSTLLTGDENVDSWSEGTWQQVLEDTRIVVSTPSILHNALCHSFVRLDMLALLVFDEAHNCTKKAPGRKIMLDFYHVRKAKGNDHVPAILGLSATPSMKALPEDLETIEKTLDAKCVSPMLHREELLRKVNRPVLRSIEFATSPRMTPAIKSLEQVWHGLSIEDDPYIISLLQDLTPQNQRRLEEAILKNNTYCQNQLKGLFNRSAQMAGELGIWASDRYLRRVIDEYLETINKKRDFFNEWTTDEKLYLGEVLEQVQLRVASSVPSDLSEKASLLIQQLLTAAEGRGELGPPVCVVFAKERATVSMLYELLTASPSITSKFRIGAVVGASNNSARKQRIFDLSSNASDLTVLQKFRSGSINLLIATSVLEEGIDVPACNFVISFDELVSFKSFVQRRGRARMRASSLIVFVERGGRIIEQWKAMEQTMIQQYLDEDREREELLELEGHGNEHGSNFVLRVESTGARIGFEEAKEHLDHFCRKLLRGEFVNARPDYIVKENWVGNKKNLTCKVILPYFLPTEVREAESSRSWTTEKEATKDAAFQAYVKLYHANLVNDNLLPFTPSEIPGVEGREAIAVVDHSFNPWAQVAQGWKDSDPNWVYVFTLTDDQGRELGSYDITLPAELPQLRDITIYRDYSQVWTLQVSAGRRLTDVGSRPDHTSALLATVFGHRWPVLDRPHVIRISVREGGGNGNFSRSQIGARAFNLETDRNQEYLVRDTRGMPFTVQELLASKPPASLVRHVFVDYEEAPEDEPYIVLKRWTKRSDFLHRLGNPDVAELNVKPYDWILPLHSTVVDNIHVRYSQFGMLIPSVIHELEVMLSVKHLMENLLKPVAFSNPYLVREAISSRAASEPFQYERLENLGDSILKFAASIQAFSTHPEWPEGYLSFYKDKLVSNSRLSRAAKEKGLAKYILAKSFTGLKWRPLYLDDILNEGPTQKKQVDRQLSTKTLADVIEALIGAAYHDGGVEKAIKCLGVFIDDQDWRTPETSRQLLYDLQPEIARLPSTLASVEQLLGYEFNKKAFLVEALTHGSSISSLGGRSYERLEFVGDAILDKIIISRLFDVSPPLSHDKMHTLKTVMVNGDFLAFVSFEHGICKQKTQVVDGGLGTKEVQLSLWKYMRHASGPLAIAQGETERRYHELRDELLDAMNKGAHYPWALFARLRAHKFFSDVFEATLGAIWLDSGSLETCAEMIKRFGIFDYLDRILRDGVECQHPKEVIGKCAVEKKVKYEIEMLDVENGEMEFTCALYVGDRLVAKVGQGVGSEEIKTKAATEAVRILTAEMNSVDLDA